MLKQFPCARRRAWPRNPRQSGTPGTFPVPSYASARRQQAEAPPLPSPARPLLYWPAVSAASAFSIVLVAGLTLWSAFHPSDARNTRRAVLADATRQPEAWQVAVNRCPPESIREDLLPLP